MTSINGAICGKLNEEAMLESYAIGGPDEGHYSKTPVANGFQERISSVSTSPSWDRTYVGIEEKRSHH